MALKAFKIGVSISKAPEHIQELKSKIDKAISFLNLCDDEQSKRRLAFYIATKAEVQRASGLVPLQERILLKKLNAGILHWMLIIDSFTEILTQEKFNGNVSPYTGGSQSLRGENIPIEQIVKKLEFSLTCKEKKFIEKTSLMEIFVRHGIPST